MKILVLGAELAECCAWIEANCASRCEVVATLRERRYYLYPRQRAVSHKQIGEIHPRVAQQHDRWMQGREYDIIIVLPSVNPELEPQYRMFVR